MAYFGGKGAKFTGDMQAAIVCREFGWTWLEYQEQPQSFIDTIWDMLHEEARATKRAQEKSRKT